MKYLILILLFFAGCGDENPVNNTVKTDTSLGGINNYFLFTQEYGYCNDTICNVESVVIEEFSCGNDLKSYVFSIATLDTLHNGLYLNRFLVRYDLSHTFSINLGNGQDKKFSGAGEFEVKYLCNQNYEVIITFIQ